MPVKSTFRVKTFEVVLIVCVALPSTLSITLLAAVKVGPWKNYLYGERVYIILSLVAKSLLAWQVFAGTLRP